ncbi:MAG: hypothetical protein KJ621_12210 [Proteobacteria bacterium]|nr:hypothetical protein [Pseudomonadota bacterium]
MEDIIREIIVIGQGADQVMGFLFVEEGVRPRGVIGLPGPGGRRFWEVPGDTLAALGRRLRHLMREKAEERGEELACLVLPPGYSGENLVADLRRGRPPGLTGRPKLMSVAPGTH